MQFKILINYIKGFVDIVVEGYYIERFINICTSKNIFLWNLKRDKSTILYARVSRKDFKELRSVCKKTGCKMKIVHKKGVFFVLNQYKKRKVFVVLLMLILVSIMAVSNFIWNIEIVGNEAIDKNEILEVAKQEGLTVGKFKNKIDTKKVINRLRLEREDIAWMGIELKGTNVIVRVVKSTSKPEIIDEEDYCSIVSDKQGIITKINAQNGTIAAKVGDTVNVGTTLINGWMEGKYTGIRYVHAKGEVEAKVWYSETMTIPYNATERNETGEIENKYKVKFNNFEINFSKRLSKFEIYDTIYSENKFKIFQDFYLPISLVKTTNKEIVEETKKYTPEEAMNIGIEQLQEKLDTQIEDKEKIVNKIINKEEKEDGIEINVIYEVLENIGTNEKIVF